MLTDSRIVIGTYYMVSQEGIPGADIIDMSHLPYLTLVLLSPLVLASFN